jgi:hypothetical protein
MTHFTGFLFCQEKKNESAYIFFGAASRGQNVSAYNVSGFKKFFLTFSTTYDTKKKKK